MPRGRHRGAMRMGRGAGKAGGGVLMVCMFGRCLFDSVEGSLERDWRAGTVPRAHWGGFP